MLAFREAAGIHKWQRKASAYVIDCLPFKERYHLLPTEILNTVDSSDTASRVYHTYSRSEWHKGLLALRMQAYSITIS